MNNSRDTVFTPPLRGHIDYAKNGYVYGWACDLTNSERKLTITVLSEDKIVASGTADLYRNDLDDLNIGDGNHGFRLKLSYEILDGKTHSLTARESTTLTELQGGPIEFGPELIIQPYSLISRNSGLRIFTKILERQSSITKDKRVALLKVYEIGSLAQETGRINDAIYAWSALNQTLKNNALCQCKLAETKLISNDSSQALSYYKSAAQLDFSFHWAHLGLATIHEIQGNYDTAIESIDIATALDPSCEIAAAMKIRIREKGLAKTVDTLIAEGETHTAITKLREFLNTDPTNTTAEKLLNSLIPSKQELPPYQYGRSELMQFQKHLVSFDEFLTKKESDQVRAKHVR